MKTKHKIYTALATVFVAGFLLKTLYQAGQFKTIEPQFKGSVKVLEGYNGVEDITIHPVKNIAYMAGDDRFSMWHGEPKQGAIYRLDLDNPNAKPQNISAHLDMEIHPHGISLFHDPAEGDYLFVVDHTNYEHRILQFVYTELLGLEYIREFKDPVMMDSPNDVVALDGNRFYFTNDHGSGNPFIQKIEEYLQLGLSNVVYFDGNDYKLASDGMAYANGVNISADHKLVYVAATVDRMIYVFSRFSEEGDLLMLDKIPLYTGIDNIEIDEFGALWVACHPKMLDFVAHSKDKVKPSPSQVYKVKWEAKDDYCIEKIYEETGETISGSSVAAVRGNNMLIGPVFDDKILWCKLTAE